MRKAASSANSRVRTSRQECLRNRERTTPGYGAKRRVTDAWFVTGVHICAGLEEQFDDFEVSVSRRVMKWSVGNLIKRVWVVASREQCLDRCDVATLSSVVQVNNRLVHKCAAWCSTR